MLILLRTAGSRVGVVGAFWAWRPSLTWSATILSANGADSDSLLAAVSRQGRARRADVEARPARTYRNSYCPLVARRAQQGPHYPSSGENSAFASSRSLVSKPSVNQP